MAPVRAGKDSRSTQNTKEFPLVDPALLGQTLGALSSYGRYLTINLRIANPYREGYEDVNTQEIFDLLNLQFGDKGLELYLQQEEGGDPFIKVPAAALIEVATVVKEDPRFDFRLLHCLSGVDYPDHLTSVVHLYSIDKRHKLVLKTDCPKDNPVIPSLAEVWKAANWHERESFDLVGIEYEGHPNLRRILLSEDWEGHPLRKDYKLPDDSLFPWEDEGQDPTGAATAAAVSARATIPGAEGGELKRPEAPPPAGEPQAN